MTESRYVEKRYGMLRFIAGFLKVLAWGALGGFSLMALVALATAAGAPFPQFRNAGLLGFVLFILYGAGAFVLLYLCADFIRLFLDMEENTRAMRRSLDAFREESRRETPVEQGVASGLTAQQPAQEHVIRLPATPPSAGDAPPQAEAPASGGPSIPGHGPGDS